MALLSDLGTEIVIPVCAVIGIVFSLVQWYLVSKVKVTSDGGAAHSTKNGKNGYSARLIDEEDGVTDDDTVAKCAEIQNAISEGLLLFPDLPFPFFPDLFLVCFVRHFAVC